MKKLTILLILFFICIGAPISPAQAETVGEIININYDYNIAFTDLTNSNLQKGDIVKILKDKKLITYLEVSDVSSAISKLIPIQKPREYATDVDFRSINIGNSVVKVTFQEKKIVEPEIPPATVPPLVEKPVEKQPVVIDDHVTKPLQELSANYIQLSQKLSEILNQKQQLEKDNNRLSLELQSITNQIKEYQSQILLLQTENQKLKNSLSVSSKDSACQTEKQQLQQKIQQLTNRLLKINQLLKEGK
jgi:hypothetical protein